MQFGNLYMNDFFPTIFESQRNPQFWFTVTFWPFLTGKYSEHPENPTANLQSITIIFEFVSHTICQKLGHVLRSEDSEALTSLTQLNSL